VTARFVFLVSLASVVCLFWGRPAMAQRAAPERRFFLRLSLGPTYLAESWTPSGPAPGAAIRGWGTALDVSVGRMIRPRLVAGGRWQAAAFVEPNESYQGTTYALGRSTRFFDTLAAFVDWTPDQRHGLHLGGSLGLIACSNLDASYWTLATGWGAAAAGQAGYDRRLSDRWSIGLLAALAAYRCWTNEAGVASASNGLLPSLALAFTLR
jgi:hypothetical protein